MNQYFENNKNLESKEKLIKVDIFNKSFSFYIDNGVFSKNGLDFGTRTLLENLDTKNIHGSILDVGCGYGVIGIILNKLLDVQTDMIDINERAINLAIKNSNLNKCIKTNIFLSNGYEKITKKYNYIITNPPIRVGKDILYHLLIEASKYLEVNGEMWFVINKDQGAKSVYKDMKRYYNIETVCKNKGFLVFRAKM